jgi:Raf kinase inhibitor-like YbhB/YbcL family protein
MSRLNGKSQKVLLKSQYLLLSLQWSRPWIRKNLCPCPMIRILFQRNYPISLQRNCLPLERLLKFFMQLTTQYHHCSVLPAYHDTWLTIYSTVFSHGGVLPAIYRSDGLNTNPSLYINSLPDSTKSMAVFLLDTDAPISARVHWICWDLPPTTQIQTNESRGITGLNDFQLNKYTGPCVGNSMHKYLFIVFALNAMLHLPTDSTIATVERSMQPHVLAWGTILFFSPPLPSKYH